MTRLIIFTTVVLSFSLLRTNSTHAAMLYVSSNFLGDNQLSTLDTDTLTTTPVGTFGTVQNTGLSDWNGRLFGFDQTADLVFELDPATAAIIDTFDVGLPNLGGEGSIAFRADGTGFLTEGGDTARLHTFDIGAGTSSFVSNDIASLGGIDGADFFADTLYGLSQGTSSDLYTIDTATGATTLVGLSNINTGFLAGLTFDSNGALFAITFGGDLYSVNPLNGAASLLGNTGLTAVSGLTALDALQPEPVPEPASIALLGIGAIGMCGGLRLRKRNKGRG